MSHIYLKPSEVSELLLKQLQSVDLTARFEEVGSVLEVSDGVVRIYGLNNAEVGELLEFGNGVMAVAMNLEEDNVGAMLLGPTHMVKDWQGGGPAGQSSGRQRSRDGSPGGDAA